jgi:hypothetical protein
VSPGRLIKKSWWDHNWIKVALIALFLWTSVGFYRTETERGSRINDVHQFTVELRNGLVASCEKNGNPLREAVQGLLEEEIKQSNPRTLQQFFPQIPPDVLESIISKTRLHKQQVIEEIEPLNCEALYPQVG